MSGFVGIILFLFLVKLNSERVGSLDDENIRYLVHISDVHIDTKYFAGSDPICHPSHYSPCCRENSKNQTYFAGMFGEPSFNCGIPIETLDGSFDFIRNYDYGGFGGPTAVLFTGDNIVGDCSSAYGCDRKWVTDTIDVINEHILHNLYDTGFCKPPDCFVLRSMGNHDGEPTEDTELMPEGKWIVDHFAEFEEYYLTKEEGEFYKEKGYISVTVGKMKIIDLNTQWTSSSNIWNINYTREVDHPMTDYIVRELQMARENDQKVITIGHIPLTFDIQRNWVEWNAEVMTMIKEYHDVIAISLWGHTHENNFYITRDDNDNPIAFSYVTGSITNRGERNTALTFIPYDTETNEILDILTYYNDIQKSNADKTMKNNWKLLRSMKHDFKMDDISPKSFDKLLQQIKDDEDLYNTIMKQRYSNYRDHVDCVGDCKKDILCCMEFTDFLKLSECVGHFP